MESRNWKKQSELRIWSARFNVVLASPSDSTGPTDLVGDRREVARGEVEQALATPEPPAAGVVGARGASVQDRVVVARRLRGEQSHGEGGKRLRQLQVLCCVGERHKLE